MIRPLLAVLAVSIAACQPPGAPATPTDEAAAVATPVVTPTTESSAGGVGATANALTADGWGPLRIGMTRAEVEAALGPDADPNAVGGADPETCDTFRPERAPDGLTVMVQDGRLTRITLMRDAAVRTDRGFGLGDTAEAVKAAYGPALIVQPHKYVAAPAEDLFAWSRGGSAAYVQDPQARGIRYEIGADGRVALIHAGGPAIQLVEGCA